MPVFSSDGFIRLKGKKDGPVSVILGGVHGDEQCGVKVLKEVLPKLVIERGQVLFGCGNPLAVSEGKRFVECDLNRMFQDEAAYTIEQKQSYEYARAQFLKRHLDEADALLDIHASTTPGSTPFIICEKNALEITRRLPASRVVSGFDDIQPGGTDFYMNRKGKIGICIECGYRNDPQSTKTAQDSLLAFLTAQGHVEGDALEYRQNHITVYSQYITKSDRFVLERKFQDFEELVEGQIIGRDGGKPISAPNTSLILFPSNRCKEGAEGFLLGKYL